MAPAVVELRLGMTWEVALALEEEFRMEQNQYRQRVAISAGRGLESVVGMTRCWCGSVS